MTVEQYIQQENIDLDTLLPRVAAEYGTNLFDFKTLEGMSILCDVGKYSCSICPLSYKSHCLGSEYIRSAVHPLLLQIHPELFI